MVDLIQEKLSKAVDQAVGQLFRTEHFLSASVVALPLTYPSGASVLLEVSGQRDRYFVCDRGGAFQEAELMGAVRQFKADAQRLAQDAGIKFDGREMFVAEVPRDALPGAFTVVANCSQLAASLAALAASNRGADEAIDLLYWRLSKLMPTASIDKKAEVRGASTHKWSVDIAVANDNTRAVFDVIADHYHSLTSTATKFFDIARLEYAPRRIAVVRHYKPFKDLINVVAAASSSVVELDASEKTLLESVAA